MWCPGCRSSYFQVKDYKSKVMRLKSLWCDVNTLSELSRELWFLFIPHSFRHSFCVPTDKLNIIFITQWTKMRKHNERVWIKHPMMQNIYCMQEELRFVLLAHKEFCIEKSSDPEYNEKFNVNLLRPGFTGWNFFDQLSIFRTNNRGKYPPVCKYRSWPTRRKEHLLCNDDEEDLALQLIHRLSRQ